MSLIRLATLLAPRHAAAVEVVFQTLRNELGPSLRGLLLAGSVASGTAAARSDLDLFALTAEPWWQRRRLVVDDVDVDLFIDPVVRIEDELAFGRSAIPISAFAAGLVLADDEQGTVTRLQLQARLVYDCVPAAPSATESFALRMRSRDVLRLIEDADDTSSRYYAALFVAYTVEAYYLLQSHWTVPTKQTLGDLASWAPEVRALVDRVLTATGSALYPTGARLFEATFPGGTADRETMASDRIPYRAG